MKSLLTAVLLLAAVIIFVIFNAFFINRFFIVNSPFSQNLNDSSVMMLETKVVIFISNPENRITKNMMIAIPTIEPRLVKMFFAME